MRGNDVLMVSGSDSHGTPITVSADSEGVGPRDIVDRYHPKLEEAWERLGISFDLYTSTLTERHYETVQEIFERLLEKELLYRGTQEQLYDPEAGRFLPDRYVEGTCPICAFAEARGDQCDNCGSQLDAVDLIEPRSKMSGATPEVRESEHFLLKLSAFQEELKGWVGKQAHWRRNVANFTLGMLEEGLKDRAITRDISWGVPVPVEGFDEKRIYVWFDAVIGYLSASKEWAERHGDPEAWRLYWEDPETRAYYFIGKDNIVFHTVIWPAMLLGYGGLNLPYDVPRQPVRERHGRPEAEQIEEHRHLAARPARYLRRRRCPLLSDPDHARDQRLRVPRGGAHPRQQRGSDRDLGEPREPRGRDDQTQLRGVVPAPGTLSAESEALLATVNGGLRNRSGGYAPCEFRGALREALAVAQAANQYLDQRAPWQAGKGDRAHAADTLFTALQAISGLGALLHPILPFSTRALHATLGHGGTPQTTGWDLAEVPAGRTLGEHAALYRKLDVPEPATT